VDPLTHLLDPIVDEEAEGRVLGCLLENANLDDTGVPGHLRELSEGDFHRPAHKLILRGMLAADADGRPVLGGALPVELEHRHPGRVDKAGGVGALAELIDRMTGCAPAELPRYLDRLRDVAHQRYARDAALDAAERLSQDGADPGAVLARLRATMERTAPGRGPFADTWRTVGEWGDADGSAWLAADTEPPPPRWLLKRPEYGDDDRPRHVPLFPRGKVGMLTAAGGVGKTTALCELALCVATGRPWLGCLEVSSPGRVLLALGEEDAEEAHRRLWKAARILELTDEQRELAAGRVVVLPLAGHPEMALTREEGPGTSVETPAAGALLARLDDDGDGWALVVLDPASRFAGPDMEKNNAAATRFVQVLEKLAGVEGRPSVLVAHHTSQAARSEGKATAEHARGATAFSDGVRWQADLRNRPRYEGAPDLVEFTNTKNNYAPRWGGFALRRGDDGGLCKAKGDDLDSYAAAKVVGEARAKAKSDRETAAKGAGTTAAKEGKSAAEIAAAVKGALVVDKGVTAAEWRAKSDQGGGEKRHPKKGGLKHDDLPG